MRALIPFSHSVRFRLRTIRITYFIKAQKSFKKRNRRKMEFKEGLNVNRSPQNTHLKSS